MKVDIDQASNTVESERDFAEAIIRTVTQPLLVLDSSLEIDSANDAFLAFFGMKRIDTIGKRLYAIGGGLWDIPELRKLLEDILPRRSLVEDFEVTFGSEEIGYKTLLLSARTLLQKTGKEALILLAFQDITALRSASDRQQSAALEEQRLRYLERDNRRLKELAETKDEFVSLTSHQLRTPATSVKQHLGMVLEGFMGDVPEYLREFLQTAYDSNDRQLKIVDDLLKISLLDLGRVSVTPEPVDVNALVGHVAEQIRYRFEGKGQTLDLDLPANRPQVMADRGFIELALTNVLVNASDYSYDDARTTVMVKCRKKTCRIIVRDSGVGIRPEDMRKLFTKFERIDNPLSIQANGTGLGLYWTREIIALHGGTIEVDSEPGTGTTFTLSLPSA